MTSIIYVSSPRLTPEVLKERAELWALYHNGKGLLQYETGTGKWENVYSVDALAQGYLNLRLAPFAMCPICSEMRKLFIENPKIIKLANLEHIAAMLRQEKVI